jgi:hypothetical protein
MSTVGGASSGLKVSTGLSNSAQLRKEADKSGAKVIDIPMASENSTKTGAMPAEKVAAMAKAFGEDAERLRREKPGIENDDVIRAIILTEQSGSANVFVKSYPSIFFTFTSRTTTAPERAKLLQVIMLKHRLEEKKIDPDESQSLLANILGVTDEKKAEVREALRKMQQ